MGSGRVLRDRYVLKRLIQERPSMPGMQFPMELEADYGPTKEDDRYHHLGKGGFGDTWEALDKHLDRIVAVKIFYKRADRDIPGDRDRYLTWEIADEDDVEKLEESIAECKVAKEILDPTQAAVDEMGASRICACYEEHISDSKEVPNQPVFLVLEMCGPTLEGYIDFLTTKHQTNMAAARFMVKQTLEGIRYLNQLSPPRIHHDLKPANLVLNASCSVKLIDLGALMPADDAHQSDYCPMTQVYSPPEVWGELNEKCFVAPSWSYDIYGLGLVYLQLLCPQVVHADWHDKEMNLDFVKHMVATRCGSEFAHTASEDIVLISSFVNPVADLRPDPTRALENSVFIDQNEPPMMLHELATQGHFDVSEILSTDKKCKIDSAEDLPDDGKGGKKIGISAAPNGHLRGVDSYSPFQKEPCAISSRAVARKFKLVGLEDRESHMFIKVVDKNAKDLLAKVKNAPTSYTLVFRSIV